MTRSMGRWLMAVGAALVLVAGACGGGNDGGGDDGGGDDGAAERPAGDDDGATGAGASGPQVRVETVEVEAGPGPARYNRVRVIEHGPADAENVLVLVPGTSAGAAYFTPVALDIVDALDGWQVWSVDRRENLLEDHSRLEERVAGAATTQETFDYYLGWLGDDSISEHFEPVGGPGGDEASLDFARKWGMAVAIDDLHAVIEEAASLGGEVVLGGHSLGGSITVAYATWDFDGRAGAEDLAGIALIDGGSGAGQAPTVEEAQAELTELDSGSAFNDIVGLGLPWAAGVFNALGSTATVLEPDEPSIGYASPLIPQNLKPPVAPTNAAQYGYALDTDTSPDGLELVQMHIGRLADHGEPRGWVDDELVPVERAARMFSGLVEGADGDESLGIDGTAWYHPRRLSIDSGAVNGGVENPAQAVLGVRAIHGTELHLPIYALETSFGAGRVLNGARLLAQQSGIPDRELTLVDESDRLTHTDPMGVETSQNPLVETLVPFLQNIA
jgi:pimeloyl-ACP methyl ester carboxylesterase